MRGERDWRRKTNGVLVRVIDYCLDGVADAEPIYRLVTTILDHKMAPAEQLATQGLQQQPVLLAKVAPQVLPARPELAA